MPRVHIGISTFKPFGVISAKKAWFEKNLNRNEVVSPFSRWEMKLFSWINLWAKRDSPVNTSIRGMGALPTHPSLQIQHQQAMRIGKVLIEWAILSSFFFFYKKKRWVIQSSHFSKSAPVNSSGVHLFPLQDTRCDKFAAPNW